MADTDRIELPEPFGAVKQLVSLHGAEVLSGPPDSFSDVPGDTALIWVVVSTEGFRNELAYYVQNEIMFSRMLHDAEGTREDAADGGMVVNLSPHEPRVTAWLMLDRSVADALCPDGARFRREWDEEMAAAAERAAHPDNLLPVSRVLRQALPRRVELLRRYAAALRGGRHGGRSDDLLTDEGQQRIAAADLAGLADELESWMRNDWWVLCDPQYMEGGPLPPLPGAADHSGC